MAGTVYDIPALLHDARLYECRWDRHLKTLHLGPDELLVAAKIAVDPGLALPAVARAIDDAEARVRAVEPLARQLYLEPDLDRAGTS